MKPSTNNYQPTTLRAFTLVELIISVSIITLFGMLLLIKHNQFGDSIALNNLAYETGLALREAQVFGISVREQGSGDFSNAYGVRFDIDAPTQVISFIDLDDDGVWVNDANDPNELIEIYNVTRGNIINDICVLNGGTENCDINSAHVTFLRPEPDANFVISPAVSADTVIIKLRSPKGLTKQVSVTSTGQISIENESTEDEAPPQEPTYTWQFLGSATCQPAPGSPEITPDAECFNPESIGYVNTVTGSPDGDCPWTIDYYQCLEE